MSSSSSAIHVSALKRIVDRECRQSPTFASHLFSCLEMMRVGALPKDVVESVVQKGWSQFDVYDAYCVNRFFAFAQRRMVVYCAIPVGSEPSPDKEIDDNNRRLAALPAPFEGSFWGGKERCDGEIRWNEPVAFNFFGDDEHDVIEVAPRRLPLEVGSTTGSRTLLHLSEDRGVARWPYGHTNCFLFMMLKDKTDG